MIKTTTYTGDGICSLCGIEKPTQQIQYTSATRKASVPICDKCFKELKPCEGCKPKKKKNNKLEEYAETMIATDSVVQIPDAEVSKEIEEIHEAAEVIND